MAEIEFHFTTEGGAEVAESLEDIRVKQHLAGEETKRLSAELRQIKESGQVSAQGIQALTRELVSAEAEQRKFAQAARQAEQATNRVTQGASKLRGGGAEMVNMLSEASLGLGAISPQMRELSTQFATAGNNVAQLGRVLPGPVGIIAGLALTGIPILITKIVQWSSSTGEAADANQGLARSAETAADAIAGLVAEVDRANERQGVLSGLVDRDQFREGVQDNITSIGLLEEEILRRNAAIRRDARRTQAAIRSEANRTASELSAIQVQNPFATDEAQEARMGVADAEEEIRRVSLRTLEVQLEQLRAERDLLAEADARNRAYNDQNDTLETQIGIFDRLGGQDEDFMRRVRAVGQRAREEREREERESRRRRGRHAPTLDELMTGADESPFMGAVRGAEQDAVDGINAVMDARKQEEELRHDMAERDKQRIAEMTQRRKDAAAEELGYAREALERQEEAAAEAFQKTKDEAEGVLGPAIAGLSSALSDVIAGSKSADEAFQGLLASFLEMIAQKAALEAAGQFAAAIASFASQDYGGGALHLAAGVAWTAVAVASGAASIAVAPPAAATPASPQASAPAEGSRGGDTVININGALAFAGTHAELGRELGSAIEIGGRRHGMAA